MMIQYYDEHGARAQQGGATLAERGLASQYREMYYTPRDTYRRLCAIVHSRDELEHSPCTVPTYDKQTWKRRASWMPRT